MVIVGSDSYDAASSVTPLSWHQNLPNLPSVLTGSTPREVLRLMFAWTRSRGSMNGLKTKLPFSLALPTSPTAPRRGAALPSGGRAGAAMSAAIDRCLHRLPDAVGPCEPGRHARFGGHRFRWSRSPTSRRLLSTTLRSRATRSSPGRSMGRPTPWFRRKEIIRSDPAWFAILP